MASTQQSGPAATHPNRNQLDELEALMERMLALPVNPPGDWSAPIAEYKSTPSHDEEAIEERLSKPAPERELATLPPIFLELPKAEARLPGKTVDQLQPTPVAVDTPTPERQIMVPVAVPLPLRPIVWTNDAFDWCLSWFGPPGRWLSGPSGRNLLAWTAIICLLGALAWIVVDALGLDLVQFSR
jgi:hypothetical protein